MFIHGFMKTNILHINFAPNLYLPLNLGYVTKYWIDFLSKKKKKYWIDSVKI